jgi:hypothetical protein
VRFPWLQVDADFIGAHAGDLGAHLGITRREAMGLALDLWTWALARAGDDAPPDGLVTGTGAVPDRLLAGSVGWTGQAEEFSAALVAVGMAVRVDGGYRLTGFGRYKATWEKNRRRSGGKPERNRSGSGEEPARKTQTQTQTQKEASALQAVAAPPVADGEGLPDATDEAGEVRPALVLEAQDAEPPKPEKRSRTPSAGEALYARLESQRQQACEMDAANGLEGVHFIPSRWAFSRQNKQLGPIAKTQTSDPEGEWARFSAAWGAFLDDTEVAARLDEPYALDYFLRCRGRYEGKALKGAA